MATIITAPESVTRQEEASLFLAGGISNCPNWQGEAIERLRPFPLTLFNPRRDTFSVGDTRAAEEQIQWEFTALRVASAILFWFPKESICPIALYELGFWAGQRKPIVVGVPPEYPRKQDIEVQLRLLSRHGRGGIPLVYSFDELIKQITSCCVVRIDFHSLEYYEEVTP